MTTNIDLLKLDYPALLQLQKDVKQRLAVKHEEITTSVLLGETIPGFRMGPGKKVRSITNEAALVHHLQESGFKKTEMYTTKLNGVPALAKLVKGTSVQIDDYILTTHGDDVVVYTG
jgi:hypothetical protein